MKNHQKILQWFDENFHHQNNNISKINTDAEELNRISYYLNQLEIPSKNQEQQFLEIIKKPKKQTTKVISFRPFLKYVAVILVLIIPSAYLLYNKSTTIENHQKKIYSYILPDGSNVILNKTSSLKFKKYQWSFNRSLELKGEAYFKVKKGSTFSVHTKLGTVQVLGTQFNVKQTKHQLTVSCYHGKVAVSNQYSRKILLPGDVFSIKSSESNFKQNNKHTQPSWLSKESIYNNSTLKEVIANISDVYNVDIKITDKHKELLFSGAIPHNNLNIALKSITAPLHLKYRVQNHHVFIYE